MSGKIDKYTLGRTLGKGVSAKVKLVTDPQGQEFAMKIMRFDQGSSKDQLKKLLRSEISVVG